MSEANRSELAEAEFDQAAHENASEAARNAYDQGKRAGGSAEGYRRADRAYREVYEREAGKPFEWFDGFPGIWHVAELMDREVGP